MLNQIVNDCFTLRVFVYVFVFVNYELGMPSRTEVTVVARQLVLTFLATAATFLLAAFLVFVGHITLSIAVVTFVQALVYVHAERLVTLVVAVLVTERAEGLDVT